MFESKMCSLLCTGSAFTPISPSIDDTVLSIRSASISRSSITASLGASSELKIETGKPAFDPGV